MGGIVCVCRRKDDQVAKATLWLPWFITSRWLHSIELAEARLKEPPMIVDVLAEMNRTYPMVPIYDVGKATALCMALVREDKVYLDDQS